MVSALSYSETRLLFSVVILGDLAILFNRNLNLRLVGAQRELTEGAHRGSSQRELTVEARNYVRSSFSQ